MVTKDPEYLAHLSEDGRIAWKDSFLGKLPESAAATLASTAIEIETGAGQVVRRDTLSAPALPMLVATGLVRVFASSEQGREVTIRYVRSGTVIGLSGALAGGSRHGVQAVTASRLVALQAGTLRHLAQRDTRVGWLLCEELRDTVLEITDHLSTNVFQSVIERVALTLLELSRQREDGRFVVEANQQQIADSVGSVREVVSRALRQLRDAGLIERRQSEIVLPDREAIERLASFGS
jgi:CRP-like cAMP-binding protein